VLKDTEDSSLPIAFSRDGRRLVAGGPNTSAGLWDTESGKRLDVPPFPMGENFLLSSDGRRLLSTSTEQTNLIDLTNGQLLLGLPGSIPFETPAAFLPDGQSFLVGGYERVMTHRDVTSGAILREFAGHSGPVIALAISPDGKRVVTGGPDTTLKLWSIDSGELLATMVGAANGEWVILTPEGFYSASAKGADYLKVVSGFDALPAERFRQLLQRPDLVAEKIAGDPRGAVREAAAKLDLGSAFAAAKRTP
jgi:WD40 repeat protein